MRYPGFCNSGTYTGQALTPACDRAINFYPERIEGAGQPENEFTLVQTPGLNVFATLPGSSVSSLYADSLSGRVFAIASGILYELLSGGTYVSRGPIDGGPYSWATGNAQQIMISCAAVGTAWIFSLQANTLARIGSTSSSTFLGSAQCSMIDDYFVSLVPNSREFQISSLLDGTTWSGLDFGAASGGADNVVAMNTQHRELWLFSPSRVEVYIDTGSSSFPFSRLAGVYLDTGCAAAASVVRMDNSLFWLGRDERGSGIVWRANGYNPQRISTHAVEYYISEYQRNGGISDAAAYSYQLGGHTFYVLHFPSATSEGSPNGGTTQGVVQGATWVYDAATNMWHERAYWNAAAGHFQAHLGRSHAFGFSKHLVGDYQSGNVYEMSSDYYDDAGAEIRRIRRAPHVTTDLLNQVFYHEFGINVQVGAGNANDPNPEAMIRWSNDGGATWQGDRVVSLGAAGNYATRVRTQLLGSARRRVFEFSTTARAPVTLVDAFLRVTEGMS